VRHEFHPRPRRILLLSALILGIAAAARPPNGLFLVLPLWSLFFGTSPLRLPRLPMRLGTAIAVVILFAAGIGCILLISRGMTGESFAYSGFRKRIVGHFPFESELYTFLNTGNAMSTQTTKFIFHWDTLGHNLRYFFVGRFAGLVPYFFPAFVALVAMLPVGGRHRVRTPVLLVIIGLFLFHLIYIPSNWHGGSCAVGNRYLISWLPAFFILIRQPPNRKLLLVTAGLTALFSGAIALSPATAFVNYRDIPKRPVMQAFPMEITLLESWPVDDLSHRRVDYGDYFIYFADDNQFGSENDGFWVKGRRRADMVIRCWKPVDTVTLTIRNGSRPARIYGSAGDADFRKTVGGGETFQIRLNPGTPVNAYNLAGNVSYCYPVRIGTSSGFIPRFTESGSTDHRFLGCFVRIGLDP
nr:hypothetical protein [bacterium]